MIKKLKKEIIQNGGFVNAHAHFDRSYTANQFSEKQKMMHLHEKWKLNDFYKKSASVNCYKKNIVDSINTQISFGVKAACTFIDIDSLTLDAAVVAACHAKQEYKGIFDLKIACQTIKGVTSKKEKRIIEMWLDTIDIIGSLPAADISSEKHLDVVMNWAKDTGKRLHVHVDQLNTPEEKETEMLINHVVKHGLEGRVTAVHGLSLATHSKKYRERIYSMAKDVDLSFISCPSAWIDHPRREDLVPSHNAITPVDEMIKRGITVGLGSDNINDIYKPYSDGDMMFELRLLLEACKIYDHDQLIKIATDNSRKIIS